MIHKLRLALIPAYLVASLLLGGASAGGFWANMALQLLALPVIVWALSAKRQTPLSGTGKQLATLLGLVIILFLLQIVPLPPDLWTKLPGRESVAAGFALAGDPLPWLPISLAPYDTVSSGLWLLPSIAALLGTLVLGGFRSARIAWALAGVAILSVMLGALQIGAGNPDTWYFYKITNRGATTGFFSNANHLATLLVATIPFLAALYLSAKARHRSLRNSTGMFVALAAAVLLVVVGIAINSSLAGLGLSIPVLGATGLMLLSRNRKIPAWLGIVVGVLALACMAVPFSAPFGNNLTADSAAESSDSRYTSFTTSLKAAKDFMPVGSGVGTFTDIYPRYENPAAVTRFYMNHVHSDYIELALETGLVGVTLILLFLLWWGSSVIRIWRTEQVDYYARAASVASGAILAHSLVDYPLRTAAISVLFAVCCALLAGARPAERVRRQRDDDAPRTRHLSAD